LSENDIDYLISSFKLDQEANKENVVECLLLALFGWTEVGDNCLSCNLCFSKVCCSSAGPIDAEDEMHLQDSHQWYCPWLKHTGMILKLLSDHEESSSNHGNATSKVLQASMLLKQLLK
jgi:hypothetical protein